MMNFKRSDQHKVDLSVTASHARELLTTSIFCMALVTGCKTTHLGKEADLKVLGGTAVEDNSDPVMQSTVVLLHKGVHPYCTGVYFDTGLILTAAHCFWGNEDMLSKDGVSIGFGSGPKYDAVIPAKVALIHRGLSISKIDQLTNDAFRSQFPEEFEARQSLYNKINSKVDLTSDEQTQKESLDNMYRKVWRPFFRTPGYPINDLAVVKFEGTVPSYARKVDIADHAIDGESLVVAGYGLAENNMKSSKLGALYKIGARINGGNAPSREVFVKALADQGTCHGDSGGPAYLQGNGTLKVFGILSRVDAEFSGQPCGQQVISSDMSKHKKWLLCQKSALNSSGEDCFDDLPGRKLVLAVPPVDAGQDSKPTDRPTREQIEAKLEDVKMRIAAVIGNKCQLNDLTKDFTSELAPFYFNVTFEFQPNGSKKTFTGRAEIRRDADLMFQLTHTPEFVSSLKSCVEFKN